MFNLSLHFVAHSLRSEAMRLIRASFSNKLSYLKCRIYFLNDTEQSQYYFWNLVLLIFEILLVK